MRERFRPGWQAERTRCLSFHNRISLKLYWERRLAPYLDSRRLKAFRRGETVDVTIRRNEGASESING
jgi:hypothetical protein